MRVIGEFSVHCQRSGKKGGGHKSGGRGEYEVTPGSSMLNRRAVVVVPELGIRMDTEVIGSHAQGKYRLRYIGDPNDRSRLHLVPLVMALARFPDPRREDTLHNVTWPLIRKGYVVEEMDFDIVDMEEEPDDWEEAEDGEPAPEGSIYIHPRRARILHAPPEREIDLSERFKALRDEAAYIEGPVGVGNQLAPAIRAHIMAARVERNTSRVKDTAAAATSLLEAAYGAANLATLLEIVQMPPSPFEDVDADGAEPAMGAAAGPAPGLFPADEITGVEGRVLTRMHSYKERKPEFVRAAKQWHAARSGGILRCECCACNPAERYGERGLNRMEAHHRVPVKELLPNTLVRSEDLAMVCPSCHDIIHAKEPWLKVEQVRDLVQAAPHLY